MTVDHQHLLALPINNRSRPTHLCRPTTLEEIQTAVRSMKMTKCRDGLCSHRRSPSRGWRIDDKHRTCICVEFFTRHARHTPPEQWVTNIIVPLPMKGDISLMTNYRRITLMSIAAKVYNKVLLTCLMIIRDHIDLTLTKNQAGSCPGRSCLQQINILRRIIHAFGSYQLPLTITFIKFKKAFDSINRSVMFSVLRHRGIPEIIVKAISVLKQLQKCCHGVCVVTSPTYSRLLLWYHWFKLVKHYEITNAINSSILNFVNVWGQGGGQGALQENFYQ